MIAITAARTPAIIPNEVRTAARSRLRLFLRRSSIRRDKVLGFSRVGVELFLAEVFWNKEKSLFKKAKASKGLLRSSWRYSLGLRRTGRVAVQKRGVDVFVLDDAFVYVYILHIVWLK